MILMIDLKKIHVNVFFLQATIDVMGRILERDAEMRKVIRDIYDSVLAMLDMKNFEKNLGSEMTKEYNGYIGTVKGYRKQLERTHCPIVVAGKNGWIDGWVDGWMDGQTMKIIKYRKFQSLTLTVKVLTSYMVVIPSIKL